MKKNYFFTLLLTLLVSGLSFGQDLLITGAYDGPLSGGTPKGVELFVKNDIADMSIYGIGSANNGGGTDGVEFTFPTGAVTAGTFIYVAADETQFNSFFGFNPTHNAGSAMGINGDDAIELFKNDVVVDTFGDIDTDGTGEAWDYLDGWAYRKDGTGPDGTFVIANWTFSGTNQLEGGTTNATTNSPFPIGTYKANASTTPSISITSPTDNAVLPSSTTQVTIDLSVTNFTLSGDNGSEMTDNTGDGYIIGTLTETGETPVPKNIFSTSETATVSSGKSYTLIVELVDNAGNSLSPKAEDTITFSVNLPCDLVLGDIVTTCDTATTGADTYSGSIAFTGGNTGFTYTITAQGSTIGGDNPNSMATGTITFSGITEGTNVDVTIVGDANSSCNFTRTLFGPTCYPLPITENFDYADGSLINNPLWNNFSGTSGDLMVASGQVLVQHGTPSEDAQIEFTAISGDIYYSFDFSVVGPAAPISGTDNEYFAMFKDSGFGFTGRLDIVPPNASGDFSVGISTDNSTADAVWATDFTFGIKYRATVKYDQAANIAQLWINADLESEASISGADLDDANARTIVSFALRQSDSNANEGILVDNLKIGGSFAETTLSVVNVEIKGFKTYPNPITDKKFTISSTSSSVKQVAIFNVLGKNVFSTSFSGEKKNIDVSGINTGIYILKVTEDGKTATKKLVIR